MNLQEARGTATTGADDPQDKEEPIDGSQFTAYMSLVARANYLAIGHPDIIFAA